MIEMAEMTWSLDAADRNGVLSAWRSSPRLHTWLERHDVNADDVKEIWAYRRDDGSRFLELKCYARRDGKVYCVDNTNFPAMAPAITVEQLAPPPWVRVGLDG